MEVLDDNEGFQFFRSLSAVSLHLWDPDFSVQPLAFQM
jgi:hypothetical protein